MNKEEKIKRFTHDVINSLTKIIVTLKIADKETDIVKIKQKIASAMKISIECADFIKSTVCGPIIVQFYSDTFFKDFIREFNNSQDGITITLLNEKNIKLETDINLLKNAIQNITKNSMEAGATKLIIKTSPGVISFIDNGLGISLSKAELIKEKGTIKEDAINHGIGLISLSHYCKSNNWSLRFRNNDKNDNFTNGFTVEFLIN
jgi:signal transduction histidine kinase